MSLHVFHNDYEWFIAESPSQASALSRALYKTKPGLDGDDPEDWVQLADDTLLTVFDTEDRSGPKTRKTCGEWAKSHEPGFLGSTEF